MAEALARARLASRDDLDVEVSSAGTSTIDGLPASRGAQEVARRHGLDLSGHRSRLLSPAVLRRADLVVAMSDAHRDTIGVIDPQAPAWTRLLSDFAEACDGDVADPVGGGAEAYERAWAMIETCVDAMIEALPTFDGWRVRTGG